MSPVNSPLNFSNTDRILVVSEKDLKISYGFVSFVTYYSVLLLASLTLAVLLVDYVELAATVLLASLYPSEVKFDSEELLISA